MKFNHEDGQSIEIGGASIYYEIVGRHDAPPLLLLHGGIGTIEGEILIMRGGGDDDHLFSRQDAVDLAEHIKQSSLENIAFAGHAAHEDRPDAVVNSIRIFLGKKSRES